MANADLDLDKENSQTLQQAIHLEFGTQNASESTKSHISIGPQLIIPQLRIPQANATPEARAAQEEHQRAADARNVQLLNAIKLRREQREASAASNATTNLQLPPAKDASGGQLGKLALGGGFTIPKLRTASGEPLDEPKLNIPLLNKLRSQNNSRELTKLEKGVTQLKITDDDGGDRATLKGIQKEQQASTALIDLTSTIIAVQKDGPPREAASKLLRHKLAAVVEHFDIPFISCDNVRNPRLSASMLSKRRQNSESGELEATVASILERSSDVGSMLDARPRRPQMKYAASTLELQHLKMYQREDYGSNIKRFRFDTPSPDQIVKEALQKSWRISRT